MKQAVPLFYVYARTAISSQTSSPRSRLLAPLPTFKVGRLPNMFSSLLSTSFLMPSRLTQLHLSEPLLIWQSIVDAVEAVVVVCDQNGVTLTTSTVASTASPSIPVSSASAVTTTSIPPGSGSISTVLEPATSLATMTATNFPQSSSTPSNSQNLSSGAIAGIAVGAVIIVLTILSLRLWLIVLIPRRKKRAADTSSNDGDPRESAREFNVAEYHVERQELAGSAPSPTDLSQRAELDGMQLSES